MTSGASICIARAYTNSIGRIRKLFTENLHYIEELFEAGRIRPAIDRNHPVEEMVGALRYVEKGH